MAAYKETEKLKENFRKEKERLLEDVRRLKADRIRQLKSVKAEFKKLRERQSSLQNKFDYIIKSFSSLRLNVEDLAKQNFMLKKELMDLKVLQSKIPKRMKNIKKQINGNVNIIKSTKKDIKKIASRKSRASKKLEMLNRLVDEAKSEVDGIEAKIAELTEKENALLKSRVKSSKDGVSKLKSMVKDKFSPEPKKKPSKKKPAKKKTAKKKTSRK